MKKKKATNETSDNEKELNAFEKFEKEVKQTIFNVLYVLLKDDETSVWKHAAIVISDYIQMVAFTFVYSINFPWKPAQVLAYYKVFLDLFQLPEWLGKLDFTTYLVVFYISIFVICLVILDVVYVSYSFTKKKFSFVWPLQVLRSVCGLFVTALFLPFLETFASILNCSQGDDHYIHVYFDNFYCWTGMHIIHATFALSVSFVFVIISVIVAMTYYDSQSTSNDPTARVTSKGEVFFIFQKIILTYIFTFIGNWPYFNDKMNKFFAVLSGIYLWGNFCLFITKILEHTLFDGSLQLYFLGIPLVIALIIFDKDDRVKILLKNINNFKKGEEAALQIRYFLHLVHSKDHDRRHAIILKGYIFHHEDSCPNSDCQLKQYKNGLLQSAGNKKSVKRHVSLSQNQDNYQLLLQHAKNMYRAAIQKFPTCTALKIQYGFFLMERLNKKQDALNELGQVQSLNPSFDEQFIIYRFKKMSEDYGEGVGEVNAGGLDVVSKFAYESSLRQFSQHIQKSASLHLEFWNYLGEDRPDIAKLNKCGSKINQSIIMVEQYWSQLQKLNSNVPKALKMYAKFLIDILNDKEAGSDLLARAKDASNIKNNYYDTNNINEDFNDISSMSSNGTPCISVSGDNDKIGLITNCNSGATRIFGYSLHEMKNHNVERLMPEMYAKNHSKILDDALAKGPENIPNKERLVFARHKSGYIFPVWLQLKMAQNVQNGIQFVALFKIDRKIISSNIAYILLNKEKRIQGISSSCMKMMNLDIHKMRRLSQKGLDIHKLAPSLFDNEQSEYAFAQKQGGTLDWYLPNFDKNKKHKDGNNSNAGRNTERQNPASEQKYLYDRKLQFSCHLNTIVMGDLGEIGWYLKLETLSDTKQNQNQAKGKEKERLRQPLFQFRYDPETGKFVREIKENAYINNAAKDPNFVNGQWTQMITGNNGDEIPLINNDNNSSESDKSEAGVDDVKVEIDQAALAEKARQDLLNEDLFDKKRRWAKGINIYRLVNGKYQPKDQDEDIKKQQQAEEQQRRKVEDEDKTNQNVDAFKNNIKSRKALQMAINDKSTPRAISNLRLTMNLVVMSLLALAITEFAIINSQFNEINENFNLIQQSYGRISEVQRIAFDVRTLIMINEGKLKTYRNYTTQPNFVTFLQNDIQDALDNLYSLQNAIGLTSLTLSDEHKQLVETKSVNLYFLQQDKRLKILKFSLAEAVLQISSAVFTARHFNLTEFVENNEDIHFITYNVYNDFLSALRTSSKLYVQELIQRTKQKNEVILVLFLSSIGTLILTMAILFPVISNVNMARMNVLSLFVHIPNYHVFGLAYKCEKFIVTFHEEQIDEIDSTDDQGLQADDQDVGQMTPGMKRGGQKSPKNSTKSNKKVIIQFAIGVICVMIYFIEMFVLSTQYITNIQLITDEMNVIAQSESYFSFAYNVQQEMIYDSTKPVLNEDSFSVAKDTIEQVFILNQYILDYHYKNKDILNQDYKNQFSSIYKGNLCTNGMIQTNLIPYDCTTFISNSPIHGLQTVLVRYFETLKQSLKNYLLQIENQQNVQELFNSQSYKELYIIQFRFLQDSLRSLVTLLKTSINTDVQSRIDTQMAAFIIFVIGLVVAYLILWTPFVNKLNKEIWRTKSMLTIIPTEVIIKIPRIQEFLHSQSFFRNKTKAS